MPLHKGFNCTKSSFSSQALRFKVVVNAFLKDVNFSFIERKHCFCFFLGVCTNV